MPENKYRKHYSRGICKYGKRQSPVALIERFAYHVSIPRMQFKNFQEFKPIQVENSGNGVCIRLIEACCCKRPKLFGGGLVRDYTLDHFHFHWPSEHVIDGIRYDLEAHFVFYADRYGSFQEALEHPYGLTVVATLYSTTNFTSSKNFRTIANAVQKVARKPGHPIISSEGINMRQFLPYDHEFFYRYQGSLTVPPCPEFVHWFIFKNPANIAYLDLKDLTEVYDRDGDLIKSNNRELQDLNDRIVMLRHLVTPNTT